MVNKILSFFSKNDETPESLQQLEALLDLLPCAACLADEEGKILLANKRISAVSGFSVSALKNTSLSKYGLTAADIQTLLKKNAPASLMKEMVTKDMEALYMNVSASRVPGTKYIILSFDSAPQYRQLVKEKAFFKSIVENYPFAVTVQDRRGLCLVWNEKAEKMFGCTETAAIGHKVTEQLPAQ